MSLVALFNLLTKSWLPIAQSVDGPLVSVLIPARNEEANLPALLQALTSMKYNSFEVIVCDDHSSDTTAMVLHRFAESDQRFSWFRGESLPEGWTGKNFSCHQLSLKAKGKFLLFLDADVVPSRNLIGSCVAEMEKNNLSLLSLFPEQELVSVGERVSVPIMDWILFGLLPLRLVQFFKHPSVAAANGQLMMFDVADYLKFNWHQRVKNQTVDDILIGRLVKTSGLKMAVYAGRGLIGCRMYHNYCDAVHGFSRNVHEYFGGFTGLAVLFWFIAGLGPLFAAFFLPLHWMVFLSILVAGNRVVVSLINRQPVISNVLLHPVQMVAMGHILVLRIGSSFRRAIVWKGREVKV